MKFVVQHVGLLSLSALMAVAGIACIASGLDTETRARQQLQNVIEANKLDLWQQEQLVTSTREKANQRYKNGCLVSRQQLALGQTFPGVPDREAVCDRFGFTGVVIGGVLSDLAITDDQSIIFGRTAGL